MNQPDHDTPSAQRRRTTAEFIGRDRIEQVVDTFYNRIQHHDTLAEPFLVVDDWVEHKAKMTHFWWMALGGRAYDTYQYEVGPKHAAVGVTSPLVDDWLALFEKTMREIIPDELADEWLYRAHHMGNSIRMIGEFYRRKAARPAEAAH